MCKYKEYRKKIKSVGNPYLTITLGTLIFFSGRGYARCPRARGVLYSYLLPSPSPSKMNPISFFLKDVVVVVESLIQA